MKREDISRVARECQQEVLSNSTSPSHWFKMEVRDLERFAQKAVEMDKKSMLYYDRNLWWTLVILYMGWIVLLGALLVLVYR